jgi:hypothetical protein
VGWFGETSTRTLGEKLPKYLSMLVARFKIFKQLVI